MNIQYVALFEAIESLPRIESDFGVLTKYVDYLAQNEPVISKYTIVSGEIQDWLDSCDFNNEGAFDAMRSDSEKDEVKMVKDCVETVKQVEALIKNTGKTIETISSYCDRYNKGKVVANYNAVVNDIYSNMRLDDVDKFKTQLYDVEKQAQSVISAFEKENGELVLLHSALMKKKPDLWLEDNEKLVNEINSLLRRDTKKVSFSMEELKNRINDAKTIRGQEIKTMKDKFHWLSREKYRGVYDNLITQYMAHSEYLKAIESIRKERSATIWKGVGKGAWSVLKVALYVAGIGFVIIYFIIKTFLSSHDDD